jgi:hypothetical protein
MRSSLYWGDNVVWVWEGSESHQQLFYDAIAQRRDDFGAAGYVAVSSDPAEITARWPWIEILDARAGAPITSPRQLLEAIHQFCTRAPRPLLLFDSLAPMADRWGMRIASGFFGHCCPMLLDLGAIAYWSMVSGLIQVLLSSGVPSSAAAKRSSPPAAGSMAGATWERATRSACGSCGTECLAHGPACRRWLGPTAAEWARDRRRGQATARHGSAGRLRRGRQGNVLA